MTNPYHDNLTTLAKRLKPLILKTATTAVSNAQVTINAGAGLTGGGTGNNLTLALNTPGTLGASSTNTATGNHTHLIDAASDVSTPAAKILESTSGGGLTLNNLLVTGGDLTVGSNILFVDYSGTRVGINCAPDAQFDLDIAGNMRTQGWIVGKHAIQLDGALMILHYDGPGDPRINTNGEINGHMGQVGTRSGGVTFAPGKFGKAISVGRAGTNYVKNPSFENNVTDSWSISSSDSSATRAQDTSTFARGQASCRVNIQTAAWGYIASDSEGTTLALPNTETATASADIYVSGGTASIQIYTGGTALGSATSTSTTGEWQRISCSYENLSGGVRNIHVRVTFTNATGNVWIDAVQLEQSTYATAYMDGSLGSGHSWSGTSHSSSSSRTAGTLSYPTGTTTAPAGSNIFKDSGTIMAWVWRDHLSVGGVVLNANATTGEILFQIDASTGNLRGVWGTSTAITGGSFTKYAWHHVALTYDGSTLTLYLNGASVNSGSMSGLAGIDANMYIGRWDTAGGYIDGYIDDLVILDRAATADEIRAVYESEAPVFAETSTFHFRAGGSNVWADEEGLWMRDTGGTAVIGASGVDSKTWGGFTLDSGDIVLGSNTTGKSAILWDRSTGKFGFYGGGGGTAQVEIASDGSMTAGGGRVNIYSSGITFIPDVPSTSETWLRWRKDVSGTVRTHSYIYGDNASSGDPGVLTLSSYKGASTDTWTHPETVVQAWDQYANRSLYLNVSTGTADSWFNFVATPQTDSRVLFSNLWLEIAGIGHTPTTFTSNKVQMYFKNGYFVLAYYDSGTLRYKYLNMSGTGTTWTAGTASP